MVKRKTPLLAVAEWCQNPSDAVARGRRAVLGWRLLCATCA